MLEGQTSKELLFFKELLSQCNNIEEIKQLCFSIVNYDENGPVEWTSYLNDIPNKREFIAELLGNESSLVKTIVMIWTFAFKPGRGICCCRDLGEDEYRQIINDDTVKPYDKHIVMACMIENSLSNADYYLAEDIAQELVSFEDIPAEAVRTLIKYFTFTRRYTEAIDLYNRFKSYDFLNEVYNDCLLRKEGKKKEYMPKKDKEKYFISFMNDCMNVEI